MNIIAGIGSRETPQEILNEMVKIGQWCRDNKVYVRSGHAEGADSAFEIGAQEFCIAYLPWEKFNDSLITKAKKIIINDPKKYEPFTKSFHPAYHALSKPVIKLMDRNAVQVLGKDLDNAVDVVVCWTKDGKDSGGTGQALRIAKKFNIPIINMYFPKYATAYKVIEALQSTLKLQVA